jgi:hypothetical protein
MQRWGGTRLREQGGLGSAPSIWEELDGEWAEEEAREAEKESLPV